MMDIMMGNAGGGPSEFDEDEDGYLPALQPNQRVVENNDEEDDDEEADDDGDDDSIVHDGDDTGPAPLQNGIAPDECYEGVMESNARPGSYVMKHLPEHVLRP
jgi:hypothetical protein